MFPFCQVPEHPNLRPILEVTQKLRQATDSNVSHYNTITYSQKSPDLFVFLIIIFKFY